MPGFFYGLNTNRVIDGKEYLTSISLEVVLYKQWEKLLLLITIIMEKRRKVNGKSKSILTFEVNTKLFAQHKNFYRITRR
jgi:hypothetical protein